MKEDNAEVVEPAEDASETADPRAVEPIEAPEPALEGTNQLAELRAAVSELAEQERAHHAHAEARERMIDNLHAEAERLRVGEQGLLLRPVVTDLQHLRRDLLHQARTLPAEMSRQQVAELLESFALSVELALERCGSVPVRPVLGEPFSPREHRAVGLLPAEHPDQDQTVGAVLADGYRDTTTERVTVPAKVAVLRWNQTTPVAITATEDDGARGENADD